MANNNRITFDILDGKIIPVTGGVFVAAAIDAPGIRNVGWKNNAGMEAVTGDGRTMGLVGTSNDLEGSLELAVNNFAAFAALTGNQVVSSGSGNTAQTSYIASTGLRRPYFQLRATAPNVDDGGGISEIVLLKLKASNGPSMAFGRDINYPVFDFMGTDFLGSYYVLIDHVNDDFALPTTAMTALPIAA